MLGKTVAAVVLLTLGVVCDGRDASASVIMNALVGGAPTGVNYVNFDNLPLGDAGGTSGGIVVSFDGIRGGAVNGAVPGIAAAPFLSNDNGLLFGDPSNGAD